MKFGNINIIGDSLGLPNKSQVDMEAIPTPFAGMVVWNTDELAVYQYNGTVWERVSLDDTNLVHKTGPESIDGLKIFNDTTTFEKGVFAVSPLVGEPNQVSSATYTDLQNNSAGNVATDPGETRIEAKAKVAGVESLATLKTTNNKAELKLYSDASASTGVTSYADAAGSRLELFKGSNAYVALNGSLSPYVLVVDDTTTNRASFNSTGINDASYNGNQFAYQFNYCQFQDSASSSYLAGASNYSKNKATNKKVAWYCGANDLQNYFEVDYANGKYCRMGGENDPSFYLWDGTHSMQLTTTGLFFDGSPIPRGLSFTQGVAATVWTITHNLSYKPVIQTWDSTGAQIIGTIQHVSNNQATVTFATSQSGAGRCV
jgi:hypothetical protein